MRILHVISEIDPRAGGPPRALAGLASAQVKVGLEVTVVATHRNHADLSLAEAMTRAGVAVHALGPCRRPLSRHPGIQPTLDATVPRHDIVHIHALWEEVQHRAARTALRHNVPYIIRPCGMLDPWSLAQSRFKKRLYMRWRLRKTLDQAAALHFTSDTERDMVAPLGLAALPLVEPNGVDLREFETLPRPGTFRERHPLLADRPIVLFLSRVHPKKGLELLIPAFAQAKTGDAMLVIAGPAEASYQAELERQVAQHGLQNRTLFTGMLKGEARVAALADADLFVLPSDHENFGIVVVEALAAGTPVIISDRVHIHGQISEACVGGVVPMDVTALSEALSQWLTDDARRTEAAERSRPFVWQCYSWSQIAARWVERYGTLRAT